MASISSLGVGSGLDLSGLLDQLRSSERQKLSPITQQKGVEQAKISAFGRVQSGLDKLQQAVATLNDASLYGQLGASAEGGSFTATASAEAAPGRYEVAVVNTARAGSLASAGVASASEPLVGAGGDTLTLGFAGQADVAIDLAEGATLADIRDAINARGGAGVSASIVNDGSASGQRLVLSSTATGEAAGIQSMAFAGGSLVEDTATHVAGRNAELTLNNITITSASNQVEGAIQGVTLDLTGTSPGDTGSVVVSRDSAALKEAVQGFVSAFNTMKSTVGRATNATGDAATAGELVGDRAVRIVESRLSRDLTGPVAGGEVEMLAQLGIQLDENGRLTLDEAKLDAAIADTPDALADFFAGADEAGGLAGRLDATLGQVLGNDGLIQSAIQSSESRVDSLDRRFERTEASVERTVARYREQFGQLDGLMARMNATSSYLTQQLDMIGNMMTQHK